MDENKLKKLSIISFIFALLALSGIDSSDTILINNTTYINSSLFNITEDINFNGYNISNISKISSVGGSSYIDLNEDVFLKVNRTTTLSYLILNGINKLSMIYNLNGARTDITQSYSQIVFEKNGIEKMAINASGNISINTTLDMNNNTIINANMPNLNVEIIDFHYYQGFETPMTANTLISSYTGFTATGNSYVRSDYSANGSQSWRSDGDNYGDDYGSYIFSPPITQNVSIQFYIRTDKALNQNFGYMYFYLLAGNTTPTHTLTSVYYGRPNDGIGDKLSLGSGSTYQHIKDPYVVSTWYKVQVDLNFNTHKANAWLEGSKVVSNMSFINNFNNLTSIRNFAYDPDASSKKLWIDDIKVHIWDSDSYNPFWLSIEDFNENSTGFNLVDKDTNIWCVYVTTSGALTTKEGSC